MNTKAKVMWTLGACAALIVMVGSIFTHSVNESVTGEPVKGTAQSLSKARPTCAKEATGTARESKKVAAVRMARGVKLEVSRKSLSELAKTDGRAAVATACATLSPAELEEVLPDIFATWASTSPVDALAWYRDKTSKDSLPAGLSFDASAALIGSAFATLTREQPNIVIGQALDFETEAERRTALSATVHASVLNDSEAQILKLLDQAPLDLRLSATTELFARWSAFDEPKALAAFDHLDATLREQMLPSVGGGLMHACPEHGANWWLDHSTPQDRENTVTAIVNQWATRLPSPAAKWVNDLPAGSVRDAATESLAQTVFERDPIAGLKWAANIQNPSARSATWLRLWQALNASRPEFLDEAHQDQAAIPSDLKSLAQQAQ